MLISLKEIRLADTTISCGAYCDDDDILSYHKGQNVGIWILHSIKRTVCLWAYLRQLSFSVRLFFSEGYHHYNYNHLVNHIKEKWFIASITLTVSKEREAQGANCGQG